MLQVQWQEKLDLPLSSPTLNFFLRFLSSIPGPVQAEHSMTGLFYVFKYKYTISLVANGKQNNTYNFSNLPKQVFASHAPYAAHDCVDVNGCLRVKRQILRQHAESEQARCIRQPRCPDCVSRKREEGET